MTIRDTAIWALLAAVISAALPCGCATAERYSTVPMVKYDANTEYSVVEADTGFVICVYYSRYQFIPESDSLDRVATSQLLSIAYEVAEKRGRKLEAINEQRIKKSMGRNGFSGITSWTGTVPVKYAAEQPH